MLICPVCRSQNMESAKFCGNCGHPFPRPSEASSTLINCPQGHIFSAVYQQCPYCPQPGGALRDTPAESVTMLGAVEGIPVSNGIEARRSSQFDMGMGGESDRRPSISLIQNSSPLDSFASQGDEEGMIAIGSDREFEIEPTSDQIPDSVSFGSGAIPGVSAQVGDPRVPYGSHGDREVAAGRLPFGGGGQHHLTADSGPPTPLEFEIGGSSARGGEESDRRTIVAVEHLPVGAGSRGKIVGWLISYTINPDGEDFKIFSGHNRIGANPVCDIVINDDTVSGSHAIIVYREGRCLIKDDLSRNGTFVNGREITESHQLQNYDQIRVGNTYLTYISAQRL